MESFLENSGPNFKSLLSKRLKSSSTEDSDIVLHVARHIAASVPFDDELLTRILHDGQMKQLLDFLKGANLKTYPPKKSELWKVLKKMMVLFEATNECDEYMDDLAEVMAFVSSASSGETFYKTFMLEDYTPFLKLRENDNFLSNGTTGLSVWQAGCDLAFLIFLLPELFTDVLELGAGCGVSGLTATLRNTKSNVILTDYHHKVLHRLKENVQLNEVELTRCKVNCLDWLDFNTTTLPYVPRTIIAADVLYDPEVIEPLCKVIKHMLESSTTGGFALLAVTRRHPTTLQLFEETRERFGLRLVERFEYHGNEFTFEDGSSISTPASPFPFYDNLQTATTFLLVNL